MIFKTYKQTKDRWNFTVIFKISVKILGHPKNMMLDQIYTTVGPTVLSQITLSS